jgi:cytochrome b6-f complex iron-sulfur subunit
MNPLSEGAVLVPEEKKTPDTSPDQKPKKSTPKAPKAGKRRGDTLWSRRNFFALGGWAGIGLVVSGALASFVRFMFPRVLFEPSSIFKAGLPEEYSLGEVSEKYLARQGVWIIREEDGFYALRAVCTHLGCTPRWLQAENKFKCPCHGSGFTKAGINYEGPAPRALERLKITLGEDGQLVVDKSRTFLYEKGQWDKPDAILRV